MRKSDRSLFVRRRLGDVGGHKRSDRICLALALVFAAIFALCTLWLVRAVVEPRLHEVRVLSDEAAGTMASSLADDIEAAVALGIPLDRMRGVEPFLHAALESDSLVSEVGILDMHERVLYRAPAHARLMGTVRAPIVVDDTIHGIVEVTPSSGLIDHARHRVVGAALASALGLAMIFAILLRHLALERINLPRARLGASAAAVSRGVFADFTPPPEGPLRQIGQSAVRLTSPLRRRQRQLREITEEVRALDTSGHLAERIDAALAPLAGLVFDRPLAPLRDRAARLWWPLMALSALIATRPLVASFVADRIGETDIASTYIAATVAAFALGGLSGLLIACLPGMRGRKVVSVVGMALAGAAIGATFVIRDPYHFIYAQFVTGLAGVAAVSAAFHVEGARLRRPFRGALVLLAAIAFALPSGALLAEVEGRRLAFATVGALCVVAAVLALAGPARRRRPFVMPPRLPLAGLCAALAVSLSLVSLIDINFSAAVYRENYPGLAMACALMGAASFLLPPLLARRVAAAAPLAALLAAAAPLAIFFGVPAPVGIVILGLGLGLLVVALAADALSGRAAAAYLAGALLAALTRLVGGVVSLPDVPIAGGVCAVLAVIACYGQFFAGRER
ncbi:MAG: hypothetical protein AcusKO_21810 [Acuticoccus sp.]